MSALPPKRTHALSALPPKADMCGATWDVRFVPKADMDLFKLGLKFFYSLLGVGAQSRPFVWVSVCEINGKQQLFIDSSLMRKSCAYPLNIFCVFAKIVPPHTQV